LKYLINYYNDSLYFSEITDIIDIDRGIFKVYPNPASDIITIQTNRSGQKALNISSLSGQLIYSTVMNGPTHQIDLSAFEKGMRGQSGG
jgi:hypothetical protein